ncbi:MULTISPECIES: DNA-processing protein DprA [Pontibacillus]|uniref:DNA-processing protein DprA n=1 Tax=Pontibacillus chungwhensis TaxID=265426 RepID=A0ABY8V2H8_9BACI|nr:DNA-processing protein DprA [Pontibacillus chungwhensis]MCD5322671.1 DNA-processing protein DprA [Pontibacillus sp. HN14]WIF99949.1 DNA-processing protein DprA [Pontibacillus chungwhensis]
MDPKSLRLALLHQTKGTSRSLIRTFLQVDSTLQFVFSLSLHDLTSTFKLSPKRAKTFLDHLHSSTNRKQLLKNLSDSVILPIWHSDYPLSLRSVPDAPLLLYAKGNLNLLKQEAYISIVGTRKCSNNAKAKVKKVLPPLIDHGFTVISGMADGIDSYAHEITNELGGSTIGVLGFGFDHCYPEHNRSLMETLAHRHLLLSEYAPHTPPKKWHFPERNRVISGMSFGTLVVEAKERSGTLITVDQALEQGREVFALPGSVLDDFSSGCHKMIQDGAKLVQNAYDILEEWNGLKRN